MIRTPRAQRGGAAKEIIMVILFLIFISYFAIVGVKSSVGDILQLTPGQSTINTITESEAIKRIQNGKLIAIFAGASIALLFASLSLIFAFQLVGPVERLSPFERKCKRMAAAFMTAGGIITFMAAFLIYSNSQYSDMLWIILPGAVTSTAMGLWDLVST